MAERKKLSDILRTGKASWLSQTDWSKEERASEFGIPVPPGTYSARIISGDLSEAGTGTPSFKLTFEVSEEGPYKGRKQWYDIWLTDAAMKQALRDFDKLGITNLDQLEGGLPAVFKATIRVAVHKNDKGSEYNVVKSFEVTGIEQSEPEPFAPQPSEDGDEKTPPKPPKTAGGLFGEDSGDDDLGAYREKH